MTPMPPPRNALERLRRAWGYSLAGLAAAFSQPAFKAEVAAACAMIPLALWLPVEGAGKALLIGSVMLVLVVETLNSAVEAAIDRISPEWHALSKRAKDLGSAAVLLALVNAGLTWLTVLLL